MDQSSSDKYVGEASTSNPQRLSCCEEDDHQPYVLPHVVGFLIVAPQEQIVWAVVNVEERKVAEVDEKLRQQRALFNK